MPPSDLLELGEVFDRPGGAPLFAEHPTEPEQPERPPDGADKGREGVAFLLLLRLEGRFVAECLAHLLEAGPESFAIPALLHGRDHATLLDQHAEAVGQLALETIAGLESDLAEVFTGHELDQEATVRLLVTYAPGVEKLVGKFAG